MSLRDRAQKTAKDLEPTEKRGLALLKKQVQSIVPSRVIADLAAHDRERTRNELRSACRRVYERAEWCAVPLEQQELLTARLIDEVLGFGPIEQLLEDDSVTEILVNGPHSVFFEREGKLFKSSRTFSDEGQLRSLIDRMLGPLGRRVDESCPIADARLPEGHRVHVVLPPISLDGASVSIRKFPRTVMTLADMERSGTVDPRVRDVLERAVRARKSIVVSGGTGSGKTTLLNALSCVLPRTERIVTIEDSAELRFFEHPHVVRLEARPKNAEGTGQVTIRDLVISALRMRPDRIVVGECRGAEALDMLQAMNTGHEGSLTTLHSNSSADVVARLTTMVRYAVELPVDVVEANIASAFDLVVQTVRSPSGARYVSELSEPVFDSSARACRMRPLYRRSSELDQGVWVGESSWCREDEAGRDERERRGSDECTQNRSCAA